MLPAEVSLEKTSQCQVNRYTLNRLNISLEPKVLVKEKSNLNQLDKTISEESLKASVSGLSEEEMNISYRSESPERKREVTPPSKAVRPTRQQLLQQSKVPSVTTKTVPKPIKTVVKRSSRNSPSSSPESSRSVYSKPYKRRKVSSEYSSSSESDYSLGLTDFSTTNYKKPKFIPKQPNFPTKQPKTELYCDKCEEIYRYCILNNMEIKVIQCLYCDNFISEEALEAISKKCKSELISQKMTEIVVTKPETSEFAATPKSRHSYKPFEHMEMVEEPIEEAPQEVEEELLNEGTNLAEVFKAKRAALISNIEKRKNKVKEVKEKVQEEKRVSPTELVIKEEKPVKPVSNRLVNRLIKGEKIEV